MLVAGLVVSLGATSLTGRALSLRLGNGLQDQAREARDAADSGFEAVMAELNRDENRMLASSNVAMQNWDTTNEKLRNPCYQEATIPPTTEAINLSDGAWRTVPGNANLRYRIRAAEVKNAPRSERIRTNLFPAGGGPATNTSRGSYDPAKFELEANALQQYSRLELTIEGQSLRNGVPVATTSITQELGVVPKCCGVSIGDADTTPGNFCETRFPRILVGLNGGGVMQAKSKSQLRLQNPGSTTTSANKPTQVLCVNSTGTCGGVVTTSVDAVPIKTIKLTPPPLPAYPSTDNRTGAVTGTNGITIISNCRDDLTTSGTTTINRDGLGGEPARTCHTRDYLRVNASGQVELCNVTNNNTSTGIGQPAMPTSFVGSNTNSCSTAIDSFCARTGNASDGYAYHCRMARLFVRDDTANTSESVRIQNNTFFIDSSRARIFLHFNQAWASPATCSSLDLTPTSEVLCTQSGYDDGQIQHVYCATPPANNLPCSTPADPDNSPRVTIYSDTTVNLKIGDDGFVRDLFTYMPRGTLTLAEDPNSIDNAFGVPNYRGSLWINNLYMGFRTEVDYQTQISVPPFSSTFTGFGKPSLDNPFRLLPYFEWIVRGSSFRSVYGST